MCNTEACEDSCGKLKTVQAMQKTLRNTVSLAVEAVIDRKPKKIKKYLKEELERNMQNKSTPEQKQENITKKRESCPNIFLDEQNLIELGQLVR